MTFTKYILKKHIFSFSNDISNADVVVDPDVRAILLRHFPTVVNYSSN